VAAAAGFLDDPERLRAALRNPALAVPDDREARAAHTAREHVIERIDEALRRASSTALLVKGGGLARTVYPRPWFRDMCDIDIMARVRDVPAIVAALVAAGLEHLGRFAGRPWTLSAFGEQLLVMRIGGVPFLVEVHRSLDKLVERVVPWDEVWERARAAPGLSALQVPALEDHALFVIQHLAASDFSHPHGWLDLELLLRAGADPASIVERATAWRLQTPTYVALATLLELGSQSLSRSMVEAARPGPLRSWLLTPFYAVGAYPLARKDAAMGLPWIVRQTALRDDVARWVTGVSRYAVVRGAERLLGAARASSHR